MSNQQDLPVRRAIQRLHKHLWGQDVFQVRNVEGKDYSFIDLQPFDGEFNVTQQKRLLVRQEYVLAYNQHLNSANAPGKFKSRAMTVVTGQPGTGKTLFLCYVLARRLQIREPVAIEASSTHFTLFSEQGVTIHSSSVDSVPKGAWALSDAYREHHELPDAFRDPNPHVIYTSSPMGRHWRKLLEVFHSDIYIMDVWSSQEFRALMNIGQYDVKKGLSFFNKYGPIPRIPISILRNPGQEPFYDQEVRSGANALANHLTSLGRLECLKFSYSDPSSEVVIFRPTKPQSYKGHLSIPTVYLATAIGSAVLRHWLTAHKQEFFRTLALSDHPSLRNTAGWLFENFAHVYFSTPNLTENAYLHGIAEPDAITTPRKTLRCSTELRTVHPPFDFYWRPRDSSFGGIDGLICCGNVVWVLQFTVGATHKDPTPGLIKVHDAMNHNNISWRLVVVGPDLQIAVSARDRQQLTGRWQETPVYACELPLGKLTHDYIARFERMSKKRRNMYPTDEQMYH